MRAFLERGAKITHLQFHTSDFRQMSETSAGILHLSIGSVVVLQLISANRLTLRKSATTLNLPTIQSGVDCRVFLRSERTPQPRRGSRGERHGIRLDYSEERRPHLAAALLSFFHRSSCLRGGILFEVPLVLPDYLPGRLLHSHVFCDRGLSPLFLPSLLQDQPGVPIRDG